VVTGDLMTGEVRGFSSMSSGPLVDVRGREARKRNMLATWRSKELVGQLERMLSVGLPSFAYTQLLETRKDIMMPWKAHRTWIATVAWLAGGLGNEKAP
jgi:hypothetical protein